MTTTIDPALTLDRAITVGALVGHHFADASPDPYVWDGHRSYIAGMTAREICREIAIRLCTPPAERATPRRPRKTTVDSAVAVQGYILGMIGEPTVIRRGRRDPGGDFRDLVASVELAIREIDDALAAIRQVSPATGIRYILEWDRIGGLATITWSERAVQLPAPLGQLASYDSLPRADHAFLRERVAALAASPDSTPGIRTGRSSPWQDSHFTPAA
jgi:hypothetical protein